MGEFEAKAGAAEGVGQGGFELALLPCIPSFHRSVDLADHYTERTSDKYMNRASRLVSLRKLSQVAI